MAQGQIGAEAPHGQDRAEAQWVEQLSTDQNSSILIPGGCSLWACEVSLSKILSSVGMGEYWHVV